MCKKQESNALLEGTKILSRGIEVRRFGHCREGMGAKN
jgi:hypothetical protein